MQIIARWLRLALEMFGGFAARVADRAGDICGDDPFIRLRSGLV